MRHRIAGRRLGRTSEHRLALMRNLSTSLFVHEKVRTTLAKAKELRPFAEKLVTLSKKETLHARRQVLRHIPNREVVAKLFDTLSARYAERPGGYTRILKLGPRRGDHAEMALVELVGSEASEASAPKKAKRSKRTSKPKAERKSKEAPAKKKKTPRKKVSKKAAADPKSAGRKKKAKKKTTKAGKKSGARGKTGS